MKKYLIWIAKISVSAAILSYLFYNAWQNRSFDDLVNQPKNWGLLAGGLLVALLSFLVSFLRWYMLVRALELPFAFRNAIRLGFIGHFFSFLTLGMVGGDLLKAIFIAHEQPGRRTEAVASVIIDRVIGLYALFVMATAAFFVSDLSGDAALRVCQVTVGMTIAGTCGLALVLMPGFTSLALWDALAKIPKLGRLIERLVFAVRMYRRKLHVLAVSLVMSLGVHALSTLSVFLVAYGLPGKSPDLGTHFVIVPIAMVANAIPLPGGLGGLEMALEFLYRAVGDASYPDGRGFVIALTYRLITILLALIGVAYYLVGRREVEALIHETEEAEGVSGKG